MFMRNIIHVSYVYVLSLYDGYENRNVCVLALCVLLPETQASAGNSICLF